MSTVLTVSQINTYLKSILDGDPNLRNLYVCGEISNFTNHYRTGHFYFTLKDETAAVKAVMFRSAASRVRFVPENGLRVIVRCSVSLYERDGVYQLYCEDMQPDGTGALALAFEQRKRKMAEMGLFDESHKKPIPAMPMKIGVITSPTGAALQDILQILGRRFPLAQVIFAPVQVQGDAAAGQIAAAIAQMNELRAADVLIVGRGGGSAEDLWAFNEELVAHAIYDSSIPVISAVGHETDFTIADFVADLRAPTPSAAAELAVPDTRELLFSLDQLFDAMTGAALGGLQGKQFQLQSAFLALQRTSPSHRLDAARTSLLSLFERLRGAAAQNLKQKETDLAALARSLELASPLKTLQRGYSLALDKLRRPIRSVEGVRQNDRLSVCFADGELLCNVDEVKRR